MNVSQLAMAQAAVDRKRHTGLGATPANMLSWKKVIEAPGGGFVFYAVEANYLTGVVMAGGGNGAGGPRLWLRAGLDADFKEITSRLPADATGDIQAIVYSSATWWVCGVDAAGTGGWLAYSSNDGATFASWTLAAGITQPLRCMFTLLGVTLWVGGDNGFLRVWTAPVTWTNLTLLLGWSETLRGITTLNGTQIMVVGGDSPAATETCAYTANGGATWANRTVALGAAGPVYDVLAMPGAYVVCGADVYKRTGDNGANWDNWLTSVMALALPFYKANAFLTEGVLGTNLGVYQVFDSGFIETPWPVKLLEPVRAVSITHPEIFVGGSDVWASTQGGAVLAYAPFITETRPSPVKWVEVAGSSPAVVHYGRVRLSLLVVTATVACTVTVYDNTAASGASFTLNVAANVPFELPLSHPLQMANGITVVLSVPATTRVLVGYLG